MFNIKNNIFLNFTKRQKSALISYIRAFVKKNKELSKTSIVEKFIDEENYYLEINNPHFEFLENFLSDDIFLKDLGLFVNSILFELKQKEFSKEYEEKQKQYQKEQRKKSNEYKMSKLKPTKKQISYYKKLTENKNTKDIENASRLDLRNWIREILEKEQ